MANYMEEFVKNTDFSTNKSIRDIVYESLRETIIEGRIPAGERIVEKEYADKLNISRTPVREAIRRLETEGLVEYIPRKGVIVKAITKKDVIEIYQIRQALECLAIGNIMENIKEEEIEDIMDLLNLTYEENKKGKKEEVLKLFNDFNEKIYNASKMPRLREMISNLNEYLTRFRYISIDQFDRREQAIKEHKTIIEAVKNKDIKKAKEVINNHLQVSLDIVLKYFD